jgi:hypothetical protein
MMITFIRVIRAKFIFVVPASSVGIVVGFAWLDAVTVRYVFDSQYSLNHLDVLSLISITLL